MLRLDIFFCTFLYILKKSSVMTTKQERILRYPYQRSNLGCASLGKSESGILFQDHSDHGASKEPTPKETHP